MDALILMTRIPIPGKTKTRLIGTLTKKECAEIHKAFLLDIFKTFSFIKDEIDIYLTFTPEDSLHLIENILPDYIQCFPQTGDNLGERMSNAMEYLFERGYTKVGLMGADIPDIQPFEIRKAFEELENNDVVIGPTFDGGYFFIGLKKMNKELFVNDIKWGNKSVLEGTIDIANGMGLKAALIEKHRDIDTKEDLFAFYENMRKGIWKDKIIPHNTIKFIQNCWSDRGNVKGYAKR